MGSGCFRGEGVAMNKKAVFFTFSALFLLAIVFIYVYFVTSPTAVDEDEFISMKTDNLNNFVLGFDQDVARGLYIAGYRSLVSAQDYIEQNQTFLPNAQSYIKEAIVNGTMGVSQMDMMTQST
jgi:hypothetical protein